MIADGEKSGTAFGLVFCPRWSNLPPINLAYVKGAISNRPVDCFDFNHEFYKTFLEDQRSVFDGVFPSVRRFMGVAPNFERFEVACTWFARVHADILDNWAARLASYKVVGFSVYQENVVASTVLARLLRDRFGTLCIAGGLPPSTWMISSLRNT